MMRMPDPGGAVVVVGGRMTRMLGLGSSAGSGGMRGVGRLLLFRLGWGRVRPFVVSFAWVGLEVAGLGGHGVGRRGALLAGLDPSVGVLPVFAFSLSRGCVRCRRACVRSPGDLLAMAVRRGCRRRGGVGGSSSWPWPA